MRTFISRWHALGLAVVGCALLAGCGGSNATSGLAEGASGSVSGQSGTTSSSGVSGGSGSASGAGAKSGAASSGAGSSGAGSSGTSGRDRPADGGGMPPTGDGGFAWTWGDASFDPDAFAPKPCGDVQCPFYQVCDTTENKCVGCLENATCEPYGMVCKQKQCVKTCTDEAQCAGDGSTVSFTPHCDTTEAQCVACVSDEHCTFGNYTHCTSKHTCVECETDDQCTAPATCVFGGCFAPTDGGGVAPPREGGVAPMPRDGGT